MTVATGPGSGRRVAVALAVTSLLASLASGPGAAAQTPGPGDVASSDTLATPELIDAAVASGAIDESKGALYLSYAFARPELLPAEFVSTTPWSGTLELIDLKHTLRRLGASAPASKARSLLRAPSFPCSPDFQAPKPQQRATAHFYLQYKASTLQNLTVKRYGGALEAAWKAEITRFGWARPPRDPVSNPPGGRYPVRIEALGPGLYGFVNTTHLAAGRNNPATPWKDKDAWASCMVLNQNYGPFPGSPLDALRATVAHEFNHSIQFGYGALTGFGNVGNVFIEGGATWMEDEVFDSSNDNYNYLWPSLDAPMGRYLPSPYPYWVVFRAMTERFGVGTRNGGEAIMQTFWEQISRGKSTNLAALNRGFKTKGSSLSKAYHDAAVALRFRRDCTVTARRFCLEEGPAYPSGFPGAPNDHANAAPGSPVNRPLANNFALNYVGLPSSGSIDVTVSHRGGVGVFRVSIACRMGEHVDVTPMGKASANADATAMNYPVGTCAQASLVISNIKMTSPSPSSVTLSRYRVTVS